MFEHLYYEIEGLNDTLFKHFPLVPGGELSINDMWAALGIAADCRRTVLRPIASTGGSAVSWTDGYDFEGALGKS